MKKQLLALTCVLCTIILAAQKQEQQSFNRFYNNLGLGGSVSTSSSFSLLYDYGGTTADPTISVHRSGRGMASTDQRPSGSGSPGMLLWKCLSMNPLVCRSGAIPRSTCLELQRLR